jgi:VanZ family protein
MIGGFDSSGVHEDDDRSTPRTSVCYLRSGLPWWIGCLTLVILLVIPNLLADRLSKLWLGVPGLDKPVHFLSFITVFLVSYGMVRSCAWPRGEWNKSLATVGLCLVIAVADEAQQAMLGLGRSAEYGDLLADAAGIFVGLTWLNAGHLGAGRTFAIVGVLLMPVAGVTFQTYQDLKHFNRGMQFERERDYQRAKREYMLALDSGLESAQLYNTIAWINIEFLDVDPAETERFGALAFAMEPDNPDILDTYGWVLVKSGRPREGLALLEKAKALKPDIYCIDLHLGVAYHETGDETQATAYLKRQIERNADDRWGRSARTVLEQMGRIAGSR